MSTNNTFNDSSEPAWPGELPIKIFPQFIHQSCLKCQFVIYLLFVIIGYFNCLKSKKYGSADTLWTVTPVVHAWICYEYATNDFRINNFRVLALCICVTLWSVRLSWRAYKIGLFTNFNHEDYFLWVGSNEIQLYL